jgi:hypothetical protein
VSTEDDGALFSTAEADAGYRPGRTEAGLRAAIAAGEAAGTVVEEDRGMIGAALVAARKLDRADADPTPKAGYLVAQLLTPYRETLAALRLPAALAPIAPPAPAATESQTGTPDWLRDAFGTPE